MEKKVCGSCVGFADCAFRISRFTLALVAGIRCNGNAPSARSGQNAVVWESGRVQNFMSAENSAEPLAPAAMSRWKQNMQDDTFVFARASLLSDLAAIRTKAKSCIIVCHRQNISNSKHRRAANRFSCERDGQRANSEFLHR